MEPRSDPDRLIEDARASLVAHLGELGRRFRTARARLDLPAHIAAHPLAAVGGALALGALLGLVAGRKPAPGDAAAKGGLGRAAAAALGALGVRLAKELAMRGATEAARSWWEGRMREVPASEIRTSYDPTIEPFLEH
jgi:hypothetical protein